MTNDDFVDIKLDKPISIGGVQTSALRMREPTVRDQLAANKFKGDDADKELFIFANLCGVAPEDLHNMKMRDYGKLQEAYADFFGSRPNTSEAQ